MERLPLYGGEEAKEEAACWLKMRYPIRRLTDEVKKNEETGHRPKRRLLGEMGALEE